MFTRLLPFEIIEYHNRYERLKKLMLSNGIDALLLLGGNNIYYFCGYPAPVLSTPRPFFLLLPVSGNPVFLVHTGRFFEAQAYNWVNDLRTYKVLTHLPYEVCQLLHELGLSKATIGCELGNEMCMNLPLVQFEELRKHMSNAHFVDASQIIWELRIVKSPSELSFHEEACRITGNCYSTVFQGVYNGMTQLEVCRQFKFNTLKSDADGQFIVINSGDGTYDFASGLPSNKILQKGDMLWIDAGCSVNRYWSDFSRAAVIGKPSQNQKDMHRRIVDITQNCVSMIRPGISCAELANYCEKEINKLSDSITSNISGLAGRSGHGVGLEITEPPHIGNHEKRFLESGMVITIEPGVATSFGTFHFEQNVIITPQGYKIISTIPQDLFEIET